MWYFDNYFGALGMAIVIAILSFIIAIPIWIISCIVAKKRKSEKTFRELWDCVIDFTFEFVAIPIFILYALSSCGIIWG